MGLKLLSMAQMVLTFVGLSCACFSSRSSGQGVRPRLRAWVLLLWVRKSGFLPLLLQFGWGFPLAGVFHWRSSNFPVAGGDLAYGTSDQCVSLPLIDAGGVRLPA